MAANVVKKVKGVILDIEGTICEISFVKEVLFPYALSSLPTVLEKEWNTQPFSTFIDNFPAEHRGTPDAVLAHVKDLMAQDLKIPYLKQLQGYLWLSGYQSGALRCPLFPDVAPALIKWTSEGRKAVIYSSGSVPAQKLLLQYTTEGDLRKYISGWYDTVNAGMKQEAESYTKIVGLEKEAGSGIEAGEWCFFSDNVNEIEAAETAGLQAVLTSRKGNAVVSDEDKRKHRCCDNFESVKFEGGEEQTNEERILAFMKKMAQDVKGKETAAMAEAGRRKE